jgi:hypothetical protein
MTRRLAGCHDHGRSPSPLRALFIPLGLALLGLCHVATPAQAQEEEPEVQRLEGVTWNQIQLVDFRVGKEERAMELIAKYAIPAYKKAGTQIPRIIQLGTGSWDVMYVFEMKEGPSEMTWETSPESVKIQKAMMEMEGGKEKMEKLGDEYQSLINRTTSFIGYSGEHGAPITADMPE